MSTLVVGITGGIGSGKTAVSDEFQRLGINVVDADIASRAVVEPGQPALNEIADHFGPDAINPDGTMNRAEIRKRVFADPAERRWLEQLTHPSSGPDEVGRSLAAPTTRIATSPRGIGPRRRPVRPVAT